MTVLSIRSSRRYAMQMPVVLRQECGTQIEGLMIELSQEGARISNLGAAPFAVGEAVYVVMPDGRELAAAIRWAHDGLAGIKLDCALHTAELAAMLDDGRPQPCQKMARKSETRRYGT